MKYAKPIREFMYAGTPTDAQIRALLSCDQVEPIRPILEKLLPLDIPSSPEQVDIIRASLFDGYEDAVRYIGAPPLTKSKVHTSDPISAAYIRAEEMGAPLASDKSDAGLFARFFWVFDSTLTKPQLVSVLTRAMMISLERFESMSLTASQMQELDDLEAVNDLLTSVMNNTTNLGMNIKSLEAALPKTRGIHPAISLGYQFFSDFVGNPRQVYGTVRRTTDDTGRTNETASEIHAESLMIFTGLIKDVVDDKFDGLSPGARELFLSMAKDVLIYIARNATGEDDRNARTACELLECFADERVVSTLLSISTLGDGHTDQTRDIALRSLIVLGVNRNRVAVLSHTEASTQVITDLYDHMISTIKSGDAMNLLPLQNYLDGKLPLEHLPQPAHAMLKQDILVSVLILHMRDLIDRSNAASILSPHYDAQEVQEAAARVEKLVGEKKAGLVKAFVTTMAQLPPSSRVDTVTQLPPLSNPKNGAAGSVKKPLRPIPTS